MDHRDTRFGDPLLGVLGSHPTETRQGEETRQWIKSIWERKVITMSPLTDFILKVECVQKGWIYNQWSLFLILGWVKQTSEKGLFVWYYNVTKSQLSFPLFLVFGNLTFSLRMFYQQFTMSVPSHVKLQGGLHQSSCFFL